MNRDNDRNHTGYRTAAFLGSASVLLLFSAAGLTAYGQHGDDGDNMSIVLVAVYLATWLYVIGMAGLAVLLGWGFGRLMWHVATWAFKGDALPPFTEPCVAKASSGHRARPNPGHRALSGPLPRV